MVRVMAPVNGILMKWFFPLDSVWMKTTLEFSLFAIAATTLELRTESVMKKSWPLD
jgi:hypothetical protein